MTNGKDWYPRPITRTQLIHLIAYGIVVNLGGGGDEDPYRWKEAEEILAEYESTTTEKENAK